MSNDPLKAARLKVGRALSHLDEVRSRIVAFYRTEPYPLTHWVEDDVEGYQVLRLRAGQIPDEVAIAVGDTVSNLRSALDYAANQLAIMAGNRPLVHFPFAGDRRTFETDTRIQRTLQAIPPGACRFICDLQPYRGGNDYLWSLTRVRNLSTHCGLLPLGVAVPGLSSKMAMLAGASPPLTFGVATAPLQFDAFGTAVLMRFPKAGSGPDYDYDLTMDVGFGDVDVVSGRSVTAVLMDYCGMVDDILSGFENILLRS